MYVISTDGYQCCLLNEKTKHLTVKPIPYRIGKFRTLRNLKKILQWSGKELKCIKQSGEKSSIG